MNESAEVESVCYFSTRSGQLKEFSIGEKIKTFRCGKVGGSKLSLWFTYIVYNFFSIVFLFFKRPSKLMYFESLSAFPVYIYKRYINKNAKIYIHYHEYTTKEEYQKASFIERLFHSKERKIYKKASWISHTNEVRLNKFLKDEGLVFDSKVHQVMPNYPSKGWAIQNTKWESGQKLMFIYVGYSLTKEGSYLSELVSFLKSTKLPIELNVYCMQETDFVKCFEESTINFSLKFHEALPYGQLPKVLSRHHIGLILYKAKAQNYIFNAPNKLFEYLSCGLDVWYPQEMQGIYPYDSQNQPKVLRLDFNQMKSYNINELIQESEAKNKITYFAEDVYAELSKALTKQE